MRESFATQLEVVAEQFRLEAKARIAARKARQLQEEIDAPQEEESA